MVPDVPRWTSLETDGEGCGRHMSKVVVTGRKKVVSLEFCRLKEKDIDRQRRFAVRDGLGDYLSSGQGQSVKE